MSERSAYTFSYFTGLTSAVMRADNQQDELFRQLALLCLVVNGNAPKHCPSLRSVKLNRLKRKSLRNACK